jgi:hypothetical protein
VVLGAAVGCYMFGALAPVTGFPVIMIICGALNIVGALLSYRYIPDKTDQSFVMVSQLDIDDVK